MHKKRASFYGRTELDDHQRYSYKLIEVLSISLFTSASLFLAVLLSPWACRETVLEFGQENSTEERFQFMCETGQINGLFKILLGSRDDAIGSILSDPLKYDIQTLFIVGAVVYVLMIISFGLAIPAGSFMPIGLSGSALGGMAGIYFQQKLLSSILPSTYALLGTAALLAGVQRNSVSLCVILIEGKGQTQALIPLIITICAANYVGGIFNEGIYEIMIELKNYSYLYHTATRSMDVVKTSDIMSHPVLVIYFKINKILKMDLTITLE
jgi:H+/Cl- antiporter ClcA